MPEYTSLQTSRRIWKFGVSIGEPDAWWQRIDGEWRVGSYDPYGVEGTEVRAYRVDTLQQWLSENGYEFSCMKLRKPIPNSGRTEPYYLVHLGNNGYYVNVPDATAVDGFGEAVVTILEGMERSAHRED